MKRKSQRGFTMLEMMVVVAILLLVMAIAIPNFTRALRRYQLESSARNVANLLLRARYEAIRSNRNATTLLPVGMGIYGLDLDGEDTDGDGSLLDDDEPRLPLSRTVQMVDPTLTPPPELTTMGANYQSVQPPSPAFQITFSPRGTSMQLQVSTPPVLIEANNIYILYLQHRGDMSWAAVTVTPAGRVRVWFYDGNAWVS